MSTEKIHVFLLQIFHHHKKQQPTPTSITLFRIFRYANIFAGIFCSCFHIFAPFLQYFLRFCGRRNAIADGFMTTQSCYGWLAMVAMAMKTMEDTEQEAFWKVMRIMPTSSDVCLLAYVKSLHVIIMNIIMMIAYFKGDIPENSAHSLPTLNWFELFAMPVVHTVWYESYVIRMHCQFGRNSWYIVKALVHDEEGNQEHNFLAFVMR